MFGAAVALTIYAEAKLVGWRGLSTQECRNSGSVPTVIRHSKAAAAWAGHLLGAHPALAFGATEAEVGARLFGRLASSDGLLDFGT